VEVLGELAAALRRAQAASTCGNPNATTRRESAAVASSAMRRFASSGSAAGRFGRFQARR
jgi:hypothetical protein